MKKLFALLFTAVMILSVCCAAAPASEAAEMPSQAGLLLRLGIMEDGSWDKDVTRGELALYLYNIVKNGINAETNAYFTDIERNSETETAVSLMVNIGAVTVGDDRIFRPDDTVKYTEACKMLAALAGYVPYAQETGGYTGGYLSIAHRLKIDEGVKNVNLLDKSTAAIMIYNALHANIFDMVSLGKDGAVYNGKDTDTVMKRYYDLYYVKGIVSACGGVDLNNEARPEKDVLVIGGVSYKDGTEGQELLGYDVKAFIREGDGTQDVAVYGEITGGNNILRIKAEDLNSVSLDAVNYIDEKGREKTAKLKNAAFIKNGQLLAYDIPAKAKIKKGYLTLIANEGSSSYNVVLITEYEVIVVGLLESTYKRIYDKYDPSRYISLNEEKVPDAEIYLKGKRANFMHIKDDDVLSVLRSEDGENIKVYISADIVSGKVDSLETGEESTLVINGVTYDIDENLAKRIAAGENIMGDNVEAVLDISGQVAYIRKSENESSKVGYVYNSDIEGRKRSVKDSLRIYTLEGENRFFDLADKISINDGPKKSDSTDVLAVLENPDKRGFIKPQLIRYALNDEGQIYKINTADYSDNMAKARYLSRTLEEGKYTYRSNLVFPKTALFDGTVVIQVPFDSMVYEGGSFDEYFKLGKKDMFKGNYIYTFEAYDLNDDNPYTDVLIYKRDRPYMDDNFDTVGIVRGVSKAADANGNSVFVIEMFENGVGRRLITTEDCIFRNSADEDIPQGALQEGDMVRYNFDGSGSIAYIKYIFRPSEHNIRDELTGMVGSYDSRVRLTYHFAQDKYEGGEMDAGGTISLISLSKTFGGDVDFRIMYSRLNKAIVYDADRSKGNRVYIGNVDNIITHKGTGGREASIIVTHAYIGSYKNVYIVNYGEQ